MKRRTLALTSVVLSGGLALGFLLPAGKEAGVPRVEEVGALRFQPPFIDLGARPLFTGEPIDHEVWLVNDSDAPVEVAEIAKSCGCMAALGATGDLTLPATLPPRGKLPVRIHISTDGRAGFQAFEYEARVSADSPARIPPASLLIRGNVLAAMLALPDEFYIELEPGRRTSPIVRTITLADELPGKGAGLKSVAFSSPDCFRYRVTPAQGPVTVRGLDLKKRWELVFEYSAPTDSDQFAETLTLTPDDARMKPAEVKIRGRVLPDLEFRPEQLVFLHEPSAGTVSKLLVISLRGTKWKDVSVGRLPPGIAVETVQGAGDKRIFRVVSRSSAGAGTERLHLPFVVNGGARVIEVPISVVSKDR